MYTLVYLYEQLKTQTLEEAYISELNSISECTFDVLEAQCNVQKTVKEIEEQTKAKKRNLLDKRRHGFITANKLLSRHKKAAESLKPYGLSQKGFKEFKTDEEIKEAYNNAVAYLNQFDPNTATESQLELYLCDIKNNVQYTELNKIFKDGDAKYPLERMIVGNTCDKEVTKADIKKAIDFLEQEVDASKYDVAVESCALTAGGKTRRVAMNYKKALLSIAEGMYYDTLAQKYIKEFNQCNRLVTKAGNYNPRNIKESTLDMNYIDSVFDFHELMQ